MSYSTRMFGSHTMGPQEEDRTYHENTRLKEKRDHKSRRSSDGRIDNVTSIHSKAGHEDRSYQSMRKDDRERQEETDHRRRRNRSRSDSAERRHYHDLGMSHHMSRRYNEVERRHSNKRLRRSIDHDIHGSRDIRRSNASVSEGASITGTHTKSRDRSRSPLRDPVRFRRPLPSQMSAFQGFPEADGQERLLEKQKPNFGNSGRLAAESNTVTGTDIVLKYNEPPDARKPPASQAWRLFVFKDTDTLDQVDLHSKSCWLFGRERAVTDYLIEHFSCSKQHAVIQFRYTERRNEFGDRTGKVKPYIIDLDSSNGTKVNGESVPERRFFELKNGDVINFGESHRDYVIVLP